MNQRDFIKFVSNLREYIDKELVFVNDEYDYPVAILNDIKIYFNHFKTEQDARENWGRRKIRINYDNIYIIMYDVENLTENDLLQLKNVRCQNMVVLSSNERSNLEFVKKITPNLDRVNGAQFLDKDKYGMRTYEKQWNFVEWLNSNLNT